MTEEARPGPVERFLQFLEVVANDPDLEDRVAALDQTDTAGLLEIAGQNGFHFTIEEFRAAVNEVNGVSKEPSPKVKLPGNRKPLPLVINRPHNLN